MFGIFKDDINHLEYNAYQLTRTHQELTSINQELTSRVERLEKELALSKNIDKEWKESKTKEPKTQTEDKEGDKEEQK